MHKRRLICFFLITLMLFSLQLPAFGDLGVADDDITFLFTGSIESLVDENLTLATVKALRDSIAASTPNVRLIDLGNAVHGSVISSMSKGQAITRLFNAAEYDYAILGTREFAYGLDALRDNIEKSDFTYLESVIRYTGKGKNALQKTVPYVIENFSGTKVALIGVTTPLAFFEVSPSYFKEDGSLVYDFCRENNGRDFYLCVQRSIDDCRASGADYIVLLSSLGYDDSFAPFNIRSLIRNISGADVLIDGRSDSPSSCAIYDDKTGKEVLVCQPSGHLRDIGVLTISSTGSISTTLVSAYPHCDEELSEVLVHVNNYYDHELGQTLFVLDDNMLITDENGVRIIRSRETGLGNFVADAYRAAMDADIGLINGGGIRAGIVKGNVSLSNLIEVNPYGNTLCVIELTGSQILDMLEFFYKDVQESYVDRRGEPFGESSSFMSVSGMRFTVNTSVDSTAEYDADENFLKVSGERRVSDVQVLNSEGEYVPINPSAKYSIATVNYIAKEGGCGLEYFLSGVNVLVDSSVLDYEALSDYATINLNGDLSAYKAPEGRITIQK